MSESDTRTPAAQWSAKHREKVKQLDPEKYKRINRERAARRRAQMEVLRETDPQRWREKQDKRNEWNRRNREEKPKLIAAQRERYNEKRRARRQTPEYLAAKEQRKAERALRSAELTKERIQHKKEGDRLRAKEQYATLKLRIASDPQAREKYLERVRAYNKRRRAAARAAITEEEKARILQRAREARIANLRKVNAKKRAERLANPEAAKRTPKKTNKPVDKTKVGNGKKKPGRLLVLMGWRGF